MAEMTEKERLDEERFQAMMAGLPERSQQPPMQQPSISSGMNQAFNVPTPKRTIKDRFQDYGAAVSSDVTGRNVVSPYQRRQQQLLQGTIMDAQAIQKAIQNEDMPKAVDVLVDRMNVLEKLGEDTSDTKMLRDALVGGRPDIVMGEIDTFLKSLPEQVIDPKMLTKGGQFVTRRLGGDPTAQTVAGFTPEEPDKPATLRALEERARLAGIPEGSEQYKRFMEFGGGSYQETAKLGVKYRNGTIINYPAFGDPIVYENGVRITDPTGIETAIKAGIDSGILEAGGIAGAQALAKGQEERSQDVINRGRAAAESTALL